MARWFRVSRMPANRWRRALAMPGGNGILLDHHVVRTMQAFIVGREITGFSA